MGELSKEDLDTFFERLELQAYEFLKWTSEEPTRLVVNPDIIGALSRIEGFYQRPELEALVPEHAPVVRYFKLFPQDEKPLVVELYEEWDEKYLHFE